MKRTNLTTVLLTLSLVLVTFPQIEVRAEPNTIAVPDDYATIQEAVDAASDGGFAFAGSYRNEDTFLDVWMIKTDVNGNLEWNQNYSLADKQEVSSLIQLSDGGFALAGRTANLNDENSDFWVLKTDEYGIPEFPSWAILPLLVVGTLLAVLSKNRLRS